MSVRLSPAQATLLRRIVATNGGGTGPYISTSDREYKTAMRLYDLGLAQGKAGNDSMAVHTRKGLAWVRANPAKEPS